MSGLYIYEKVSYKKVSYEKVRIFLFDTSNNM